MYCNIETKLQHLDQRRSIGIMTEKKTFYFGNCTLSDIVRMQSNFFDFQEHSFLFVYFTYLNKEYLMYNCTISPD